MHFILLGIGLLVGAVFLFRFFVSAKKEDIKPVIYTVLTVTVCLALFIMAVTGKLPAAIAVVAAIWPFLAYWWQRKNQVPKWEGKERGGAQPSSGKMDIKEALDVLGVDDTATKEEIKKAHKKLMQKLHPDLGGSEGIARKLNEARDLLLKKDHDD